MKRFFLLVTILLMVFSFSAMAEGQSESSDSFTLKYAGVLPYEHPTSQAIEIWAKDIEERTNGRIMIQLYHGGSLGKSTEVAEYLQLGTIAFSNVSTAFFGGFDQKYDIFSLPYLFRDQDHMEKALAGDFGIEMKNLLISEGIRGLAFPDSGSRSVYTKDIAVNTPDDLAGVKIRVMSKVAVNSMNALGADGVPIPWGELYTSLQTGIVDAAENNPPSIIAGKHYEVVNKYSLTEHFRTPDMFIVSEKVFEELGVELQTALLASINEVLIPEQKRLFAESTLASMEELKALGMEINVISNLKPFVEATASVRTDVAQSIGMTDWVKKISEM